MLAALFILIALCALVAIDSESAAGGPAPDGRRGRRLDRNAARPHRLAARADSRSRGAMADAREDFVRGADPAFRRAEVRIRAPAISGSMDVSGRDEAEKGNDTGSVPALQPDRSG